MMAGSGAAPAIPSSRVSNKIPTDGRFGWELETSPDCEQQLKLGRGWGRERVRDWRLRAPATFRYRPELMPESAVRVAFLEPVLSGYYRL